MVRAGGGARIEGVGWVERSETHQEPIYAVPPPMGFAGAQPILRARPSTFRAPNDCDIVTATDDGGNTMHYHNALGVIGLALVATCSVAQAFDDTKYPDLWGQWIGVRIPGVGGQPGFDPTKPWGRGQQAPLTAEYQAVLETSLADQARG